MVCFEKQEQMVWKNEGKHLQLVRTSGSTNEALEFYTSSSREAHINAARMRGHEWVVGYSFIYIARSVKGIVKVQVQKRLNSDDKIIVKIVDDVKPAPSGKYRPVISKVAEELFRNRSLS
jgi:hypothetical protein